MSNVELKDVDSLEKDNYELVIHSLFKEASVLNHHKAPCDKDFIPDTKVRQNLNLFQLGDLVDIVAA